MTSVGSSSTWTLLPERASMEKLIDITVTFNYNGLLENLI